MTTIDQFSAPAEPGGGDKLPLADLLGSLLLFTVGQITEGMDTEYGKASPVGASVAVLDGDKKGEVFDDALIFPRVLISQLKHAVGGGMVLGRLEQGEKKPGKNPPWRLADPTDDDKATARKYLAYVAEQTKGEEPF